MDLNEYSSAVSRVRGVQVIGDMYLAVVLGQSVSHLRALVNRHAERFPPDFVFALTDDESARIGTLAGERPVLAFTECGVSMLFTLLRSPLAAEICVTLLRRLRALRHLVAANAATLAPLNLQRCTERLPTEEARPLAALFAAFARIPPLHGVFLRRALYAPRAALARLFAVAKQSIEIQDESIPPLVLDELARRRPEVVVKLVTTAKYAVAKRRLAALNARRQLVSVEYRTTIKCRMIILDGTQCFRLGRSLRDLGKESFAIIKEPRKM